MRRGNPSLDVAKGCSQPGQLETIMTYTVHIDNSGHGNHHTANYAGYNPAVVLISSFHYQIIMTKRFHFRNFRVFWRKKENYYYYYSNMVG